MVVVRARGVSAGLLGQVGDSLVPRSTGAGARVGLGFVRGWRDPEKKSQPAERLAVKRHGALGAWRGVGWRRDGAGRTGSLVPVKNILCRSRVDRGGKSNHMPHGTGAGPTAAAAGAVCCAGSIGLLLRLGLVVGWTPSCRGGPGDGDGGSLPAPLAPHWLA